MPRQARMDAPDALQHIGGRGSERRQIVADEADRNALVARPGRVLTAAIVRPTKRPPLVAARRVVCDGAVRERRGTTAAVARRLGLAQSAVGTAVQRGEDVARRHGLRLVGE